MADFVTGFAGVGVACILVIVLALQLQIRTMSKKIDDILKKVG